MRSLDARLVAVVAAIELAALGCERAPAQVEVRRGGIKSGFHAEGFSFGGRLFQAFAEILLADQLREAFLDVSDLFFDGERSHPPIVGGAGEPPEA